MTTEEKVIGRERRRKKQETLECPPTPLKTKRGRKPLSPSPQAPPPPSPPPPPPPSPVPLSFFKVMVGDFNKVLYIPPMAACTLKDLEKKYVYIEDADGKYWNVKMSMVDGSLAFQKGWDDFYSAHSITVGEFVLFTYTGGLLFTARIFGTSSLERVDFQMNKRRGRYAKEKCTAELKPDYIRPSKRKKVSHASEVKQSPSNNDVSQMLEREKEATQFDLASTQVIESDHISRRVLEVPSACQEPLNYDSNCKGHENVLRDSEQTWHRNMDATVEEANKVKEPNIKAPNERMKLDAENVEAIGNEPAAITKSTNFAFEAHSDISLPLPGMNGSQFGKMEENTSHNLEILNDGPHSENMNVVSNPEQAEGSQVKLNTIEPDVIPSNFFLTADGICYNTLDEKLTEIATETCFDVNGQEEHIYQHEHATSGSEISVPCEDISVSSSNPILDFPNDEKESLMSTNEECENLQIKERSQVKSDMIEPDGSPDKIFLTTDGICYDTLDENLTEVATGTSLGINGQEESINQNEHSLSVVSSNPILVCPSIKEETSMPSSEEYRDLQFKDEICYNTLGETLAKLAIGTSFINGEEEPICQDEHATIGLELTVPCELISDVSSNPMLLCTSEKKEILMSTSEEYGDLPMKGSSTIAESGLQSSTKVHDCIGHDAFTDEDVKDVTPCSSCKSSALTERRDSNDIPSSNCDSFSVCLSDDVQSSLELPKKLISQIGKLKNERKVMLLQDPSMKCWPVLYHQSINFIGFIGGWVDFARANNICQGDICEFELLNKTELKFLVQIRKQEGSIFDEMAGKFV